MKFPCSLTLVLALCFSACDEPKDDVAEDVVQRVKRTHENEYIPPPVARQQGQAANDAWLKANPDAAEGGGGCEMIEEEPGPTGAWWLIGRCCDDLDDAATCTETYQARCSNTYGCVGGPL